MSRESQDQEERTHGAEDVSTPFTARQSIQCARAFLATRQANHRGLDIEKECVRQFFSNLHTVYPFFDRAVFDAQCEASLSHEEGLVQGSSTAFLALYCAVLALGAVTASPDSSPDFRQENIAQCIRAGSTAFDANSQAATKGAHKPLHLGWWYFRLARRLVGDVFSRVTLETVQTLFLMASGPAMY